MNREIKKQWIEALRSGEYKQIKRLLRNDNGFCCLGVLCDLNSKSTGTKWDEGSFMQRYQGNWATLPEQVVKWAELENHTCRSEDGGGFDVKVRAEEEKIGIRWYAAGLLTNSSVDEGEFPLSTLNDKTNIGFSGIADLIEKEL